MLFNSLEFSIFLPIVFLLFWFVFNKRLLQQNLLILFASYVFYGWWDWRFLMLIIFSSIADYLLALNIYQAAHKHRKKIYLIISIVVNIGILGFFKYFNFFSDSFVSLFQLLGLKADFVTLNIILPVGISFYTFQTLSYTIDVYKGKMEPTKDIIAFFAFVSFFPQLVAGPIERARDLLPQFFKPKTFDPRAAEDGLRQILWGLFKKIVIADNCALFVNEVFANHSTTAPVNLLIGIFYFAIQIYCDFSGYSDIAIGTARLFNFNLSQNFAFPYFSRDIGEFWRRWHISLSTWFRDYVYIPLGGNRKNTSATTFNILIVFVVSGLWHGANWTYVFWGFLNGIYLLPLILTKKHKANTGSIAPTRIFPSVKEVASICLTFTLTLIAWVFFRSPSISVAFEYLYRMMDFKNYDIPRNMGATTLLPLILFLMTVEWFQRNRQHGLEFISAHRSLRWSAYFLMIFLIAYFYQEQDLTFIYFQF